MADFDIRKKIKNVASGKKKIPPISDSSKAETKNLTPDLSENNPADNYYQRLANNAYGFSDSTTEQDNEYNEEEEIDESEVKKQENKEKSKQQDIEDAKVILKKMPELIESGGTAILADPELLKAVGRQAIKQGLRQLKTYLKVGCGCLMAIIGISLFFFGIVNMSINPSQSFADENNELSSVYTTSKVPYYSQCDKNWGNNSYGCGQTICSSGCGVTSLAMTLTFWLQKEILPPEIAKVSLDNGFRVCGAGTAWEAMTAIPKKYGVRSKNIGTNWSTVKKYLEIGYPVIQSHGPGHFTKGGHYIVLTGVSGDTVYVNDPNPRHKSYQKGVPASWINESVKNSWVVFK